MASTKAPKFVPPFSAAQFSPTKWDDGASKAKAANDLARFLWEGCPEPRFTRAVYHTLYQHLFSHIAETDKGGFWYVWFDTASKRLAWYDRAIDVFDLPIYGDPAYTWSDVAKAVRAWLIDQPDLYARYHQAAVAEQQANAARLATESLRSLTPDARAAVLAAL